MGGNTFYSNAEAYAFEILQQRLVKEAQKSMHQAALELSAFKSLFNQGQFIYCIPIREAGFSTQATTFPFFPQISPLSPVPPIAPAPLPPETAFAPLDPHHHSLVTPNQLPCTQSTTQPALPAQSHLPQNQPVPNQSILHVNFKNGQSKTTNIKSGADECNFGETGIELTIDLREYLPAEISLDVDEKYVEIKVCHLTNQGSKTFARRYDLPACIVLDSVKCVLTHDGCLLFSAAWVKME